MIYVIMHYIYHSNHPIINHRDIRCGLGHMLVILIY